MVKGDLIVGVGSPHGDDAVGWLALDRLREKVDSSVRLVPLREPVDMTFHLVGCRRLWILDGCRSGSPAGSVFRLVWPDQRVQFTTSPSSHGVNIDTALRLSEALGRLPSSVVIFTVELADSQPGAPVAAEVAAALSTIEDRVLAELDDCPTAPSG
jgi:hydrogenase maturation protease